MIIPPIHGTVLGSICARNSRYLIIRLACIYIMGAGS